jgi:phosphoglycolate phosphatase-like HAD superfamily hydrolase
VLLLFDVDGTLLGQAAREHRDALHRALHEVHGIDAQRLGRNIAPAGRTDGEISRLLLLEAGIPARQIDERRSLVREACSQFYVQLCPPSLTDRVLPGIPELLQWLDTLPDVRLSLVTGNFEPVARLKLKRAGLGRYFPHGQGAYGSDSEDRAALPHIARKRAGAAGVAYPRAQTYVIGDTPRDIACARADEVHCLAVASGPFPAEELDGADAVAADATQLRTVLENLVGG